jgi:hypothetical protein
VPQVKFDVPDRWFWAAHQRPQEPLCSKIQCLAPIYERYTTVIQDSLKRLYLQEMIKA